MKLNKILGASIAAFGVAASFAGAVALYIAPASNTGFGIGAGTWGGSDGTVNYLVNGKSSDTLSPSYLKQDGTNGGTAFGGDYTQAHYSFTVGASFANGMPNQSYVLGNLSIGLSNVNAALINNAKIYIKINGYTDGTLGAVEFKNAFMASDSAGDAITSATYTNAKDITVASAGQTIDVYVKLDAKIESGLLALNEGKAYDLAVTWTTKSDSFKVPNVVGKKIMWADDPKYAMVPNIGKTDYVSAENDYEWMYSNLSGTLEEGKCRIIDHYTEDDPPTPVYTWSSGDNTPLDSSKTYNVYWNGKSTGAASFQEKAA